MSGIGPEQLNMGKLSKVVALKNDIQGDKLSKNIANLSTVQKEKAGLNNGNGLSDFEYLYFKEDNPASVDQSDTAINSTTRGTIINILSIIINNQEYIVVNRGNIIDFYSITEGRIDSDYTLVGSITNPNSVGSYDKMYYDENSEALFLIDSTENYLDEFNPWTTAGDPPSEPAENEYGAVKLTSESGYSDLVIDHSDPVAKNLTAIGVKSPSIPSGIVNNVGAIRIIKNIPGIVSGSYASSGTNTSPILNPTDIFLLDPDYTADAKFGSSFSIAKIDENLNALVIGRDDGKVYYYEFNNDFSYFSHPGLIELPTGLSLDLFAKKLAIRSGGETLAISGREDGITHKVFFYDIQKNIYTDGTWVFNNSIEIPLSSSRDIVWIDSSLLIGGTAGNYKLMKIYKRETSYKWELEHEYTNLSDANFAKEISYNGKFLLVGGDRYIYYMDKFLDNSEIKKVYNRGISNPSDRCLISNSKNSKISIIYENNLRFITFSKEINDLMIFESDRKAIPLEDFSDSVPELIKNSIKNNYILLDTQLTNETMVECSSEFVIVAQNKDLKFYDHDKVYYEFDLIETKTFTHEIVKIFVYDVYLLVGIDNNSVILHKYNDSTNTYDEVYTFSESVPSNDYGSNFTFDGDHVIISAPYADTDFTNSGSIYIYERVSDTEWLGPAIRHGDRQNHYLGKDGILKIGSNIYIGDMNYSSNTKLNNGRIGRYIGSDNNSWANPTYAYGEQNGEYLGGSLVEDSSYLYASTSKGRIKCFYQSLSSNNGRDIICRSPQITKVQYYSNLFFVIASGKLFIYDKYGTSKPIFEAYKGFGYYADSLYSKGYIIENGATVFDGTMQVKISFLNSNYNLKASIENTNENISEVESDINEMRSDYTGLIKKDYRRILGEATSNKFGSSLDFDFKNDDQVDLIISERYYDLNRGKVNLHSYISFDEIGEYEFDEPVTYFLGESQGDYFGHKVLILRDHIIVSAPYADKNFFSQSGGVYIYDRSDLSADPVIFSGAGNSENLGLHLNKYVYSDSYVAASYNGGVKVFNLSNAVWTEYKDIPVVGTIESINLYSLSYLLVKVEGSNTVSVYSLSTGSLHTTLSESGETTYGNVCLVTNSPFVISGDNKVFIYDSNFSLKDTINIPDSILDIQHKDTTLYVLYGNASDKKLLQFKWIDDGYKQVSNEYSFPDSGFNATNFVFRVTGDKDKKMFYTEESGISSAYFYYFRLDSLKYNMGVIEYLTTELVDMKRDNAGIRYKIFEGTADTNGVLPPFTLSTSSYQILFVTCVYDNIDSGSNSKMVNLTSCIHESNSITCIPELDTPASYSSKNYRVTVAYMNK